MIWHAIHSAVGWRADKFSALQSNDDEDIEQVKADGRSNKQVHGGDVGCMVTQEGAPPRGAVRIA